LLFHAGKPGDFAHAFLSAKAPLAVLDLGFIAFSWGEPVSASLENALCFIGSMITFFLVQFEALSDYL
jgi:hypothetical protein